MSLEGLYLVGLILEILPYIKAIGAQGIVLKIRCIVVKKNPDASPVEIKTFFSLDARSRGNNRA